MNDDYAVHVSEDGTFSVSHSPPGISIEVLKTETIPVEKDVAEDLIEKLQENSGLIFNKDDVTIIPDNTET